MALARLQQVLATERVPDTESTQTPMPLAWMQGCLRRERHCPEHRWLTRRQQDQRRGTSAERGYDADHRRLRVLCFGHDEWKRADCGWEPNVVTDLRLDLDNLRTRRNSRHNAKTMRELAKSIREYP
jgi:hypothetical protein